MPSSYTRLGVLAAHVGAELDHPPELAARDLDLLVDVGLGPAGRRQPERIRLRPSISRSISLGSIPASSAVTIARGGSGVYATSTAGMKPTRRRAMPARSNTSPNSSIHLAPHPLEVGEQVTLGHVC